jgi:cellulose synthase operon protein C
MSPPDPPERALAVGSEIAIPRRDGGAGAEDPHRVAEYLDGLLEGVAQTEFLHHLSACSACQAALHGEVQLRDREDQLRDQVRALPRALADVVPITRARSKPRSRRPWLIAAMSLAAVAAVGLLVTRPWTIHGTSNPPEQLALAAKRSFEVRLAWPGASAHRPYDPMRSSSTLRGERITPEDIARLSRAGNCAGVAAAYLLSGEFARAGQQYAEPGCGSSPDLQADRAALAVLLGKPEDALELADGVLADHPDHAVALWNRALALRDLKPELGLAAAAAFDRVAAIDPAWADEARRQAATARKPLDEMSHRWEQIMKLGSEMIPDGPIIPLELARAIPGRARLRFHDAVRTATSIERLEALRPLARILEGAAGEHLERYIDEAKRRLRPERAELVPKYVEILRDQAVKDDASWRRWKARARALGAEDLLLGAMYLAFGADQETVKLAADTRDPWFVGLVEIDQFYAHLKEDSTTAAAHLARLEALCTPGAPRYLCMQAKLLRSELALELYQPAIGAAVGREAIAAAEADGEFAYRTYAIGVAGENERFRGAFSQARAYYEESSFSNEDCLPRRLATNAIASMAFARHRFADLQRLLATIPTCDDVSGSVLLDLQASMMAAGLRVDRTEWERTLAAASRASSTPEANRRYFEYLRLRAQLAIDPEARRQLRALIAAASESPEPPIRRLVVYGETALMVDAGRRAQWQEALQIAAGAHGLASPPARCALALVSDDFRFAAVAVSAAGEVTGSYQADVGPVTATPPALPFASSTWHGCEDIAVLAFSPWLSVEPPLDPALAWHFVLAPPAPPRPSGIERIVIVASTEPPSALSLPTLPAPSRTPSSATVLTGNGATLERVAAAAAAASLLEFHVHTAKVPTSDAPALALSESGTRWALTAEQISTWKLSQRPVVLLADCAGAVPAKYAHVAWSLPAAFLAAGAGAVVAALTDLPDAEAGEFFAAIRAGLRTEANLAKVVARARAEKIARDPTSWARQIVVFQ